MSEQNYQPFDIKPSFLMNIGLKTGDISIMKFLLDIGVVDKNSIIGCLNIARKENYNNIEWLFSQYLPHLY